VMKKAILAGLVSSLIIVAIAVSQGAQATNRKHAQIGTPGGANVNFVADNIQRQDQTMQLKGNVEIRTTTLTLTADEADYDRQTGEIEARGTIRVKPNSK